MSFFPVGVNTFADDHRLLPNFHRLGIRADQRPPFFVLPEEAEDPGRSSPSLPKLFGVVPQQPPRRRPSSGPCVPMEAAYVSGGTSKTVVRFLSECHTCIGVDNHRQRTIFQECWQKHLKLIRPGRSSSRLHRAKPFQECNNAGISAPVRSFPWASKIMVAATGSFEFSFAAKSAAFISSVSLKVSSKMRSAPAFSPSRTIWANAS